MADDKTQAEQHEACMKRFIDLANEMKDEGTPINVVAWSLMSACGLYSIYSVAGNEGGLNSSGIEKMTDAFRQNLTNIQARRRQHQERQQQENQQGA